MRRCNEPHPERPQTVCIQPESGRHLDHVDGRGTMWPNVQVQEQIARAPKRRKGRRAGDASDDAKKKIKAIAAGAEPERHVNPLADGRPPHRPPTHGPSPETRARWDRSAWKAESAKTFSSFLSARAEPFTTPEHLWPLIDAPVGDMRAMSAVVQDALRANLMEEVGSVRLRGTYRTRDGVEFAMNKLTPIYRSKIFGTLLPSGLDSKQV